MSGTAAVDTAKPQSLDELMLAMDVVDTIRHRELIVERELTQGDRDAALRKRLHEIYATQGIVVSDTVLDQGIKALKESRFTYSPPAPSFARSLALLWIKRTLYVKRLTAIVFLLTAGWAIYQFAFKAPAERAQNAAQIELTETLPAELQRVSNAARIEAREGDAFKSIETMERDGRLALNNKDAAGAKAAIGALRALQQELVLVYTIRVVSRPGEASGIERIPDDNPSGRNYYLIVEAVTPAGQKLERTITSEETQTAKKIDKWGLRVPQSYFEHIKRDKLDNGIIDANPIATKDRGQMNPHYKFAGPGGAITDWEE